MASKPGLESLGELIFSHGNTVLVNVVFQYFEVLESFLGESWRLDRSLPKASFRF